MNDLIHSYRSLPVVPKVVVGGVGVLLALVLLVNLPHIVGAVVAVGVALIGLLFSVAVIVGLGVAIYFLIRAFSVPRR